MVALRNTIFSGTITFFKTKIRMDMGTKYSLQFRMHFLHFWPRMKNINFNIINKLNSILPF